MNRLGIFVKQPIAGKVKTRLAAKLGDQAAADIYESFVRHIVHKVSPLDAVKTLAYVADETPAETEHYFSQIAGQSFELWPQPNGDLGHRMTDFFRSQFDSGATRVVLIGSDSPTLPADYLEQAFGLLESKRVVIGPAMDGGYYLVGMNRFTPEMFTDIEWSSNAVLKQTVERLQSINATLGVLPPWYDIDTIDDLEMMRAHRSAMQLAGQIPPKIR